MFPFAASSDSTNCRDLNVQQKSCTVDFHYLILDATSNIMNDSFRPGIVQTQFQTAKLNSFFMSTKIESINNTNMKESLVVLGIEWKYVWRQ